MSKVVLITGASSGIGASTAKKFAEEGYIVWINYCHNDAGANEVLAEIHKKGGEAYLAKFDVADYEAQDKMIEEIIEKNGKIDVLVNNAGTVFDREFEEITPEQVERVFKVNAIGPLFLSKKIGEVMLKNGYGKIVNVSSTGGIYDYSPWITDYKMSKAAMISLTKNLSVQYAGKINVNDVAPSWVDTPMNEGLSKAFMEESLQKFSIQRQADPMEIANVIFFLASDEASFINGEVIVVDGGRK